MVRVGSLCPGVQKGYFRAHDLLFCQLTFWLCFKSNADTAFQMRSAPSVNSLKKAMQTYARQGGTSAIFVHDDGLQIISEEERKKRISFYADHNIGWVARPGHSSDPDGFKRAGRFKKASNMNYGLQVSQILKMTHVL